MRWLIVFFVLSACAGDHSFPTMNNFNKKCFSYLFDGQVHWNNCEDKFKALEDIHKGEIDLWQYKRTF
tara:strand:+ start:234 stop:437 length:204 start_codon:yes stop_codon:yes gene_type:complete